MTENVQLRYQVFQKSRSDSYDIKQNIADAIAGEHNQEATKAEINESIDSAPVVIFTWQNSPSCNQAIKYLDVAGAKEIKNVRLDDPYEKGNPMRAELGKMFGKTSVPCIFIWGEYMCGFDAGVSDSAPGIMDLAFKGTLRTKLEGAGAL